MSPTDDGAVGSRLIPVELSGYAANPNDALQIRAWNYDRGGWELIKSFASGTSAIGVTNPMYAWSSSTWLGDRYWGTSGTPCSSPGVARLQVFERYLGGWAALRTFDAAGRSCLFAEIGDHVDYATAGADCNTGEDVVVHAPSTCVTAAEYPQMHKSLIVTDDVTAWVVRDGSAEFVLGDGYVVSTAPGRGLHLRADVFGTDLSLVVLEYPTWVRCQAASGAVSAVRLELTATRRSPSTAMVGPGTLGIAADLDPVSLRRACPIGTTPLSAHVFPRVRGGFLRHEMTEITPRQPSFLMTL